VHTEKVDFGHFDDAAKDLSEGNTYERTTTNFFRIRNAMGTALMNATNFLFEDTLTPTFHSGNQPGGCNAHRKNSAE
jgi:hypothetical protein